MISTSPESRVRFAPMRAGDDAGDQHRDTHDRHVAGEQQRDLARRGAELVGDRLEDRVDEADAHERDDAREGDGPDGTGLLQHSSSLLLGVRVVRAQSSTGAGRESTRHGGGEVLGASDRTRRSARRRGSALRRAHGGELPATRRRSSRPGEARASSGCGSRCTQPLSTSPLTMPVIVGWLHRSACARAPTVLGPELVEQAHQPGAGRGEVGGVAAYLRGPGARSARRGRC